ncbi:MAG: flavodoxin family protein [Bacilli bacterium]|jgi:multimeric flavodoxin WrbA|nr:flavodoxin family protein [Bacilli bacterium]
MKVLVISSSLRTGSNSETLALSFAKGAQDKGYEMNFVSLKGKTLRYCLGCLVCQKTKTCVQKDDASALVALMKEADVIAFASPVYYYGISGQLKTLLDRSNPLYTDDYHFRKIYFIGSCAEKERHTVDRAKEQILGWVDCYEMAKLVGVVYGIGLEDPNSIANDTKTMDEAYRLGNSIT